jgi:HD-GYP domain-containing protein (c-di-GMP phosphodiesterase class II)/DNA-binding CsgD family transcriptional regulator
MDRQDAWETVLACEPRPHVTVSSRHLDEVARGFAEAVDLKSPYFHGHSERVARLAESAAGMMDLAEPTPTDLRRAGLFHDLGRAGVSTGIWEKPGPLSTADWEQVRLHPYHTERILSRSPTLAPLSTLAGMHHERLNGRGYHRGARAAMLEPAARVLAAADVWDAMTSERPHRPALKSDAATRGMQDEVAAGSLDRDAVAAVLEAAGQTVKMPRGAWPAELTEREVQVLRLLARGYSMKQIAGDLFISPATVHTHVAHIYEKTGLSSRASVALFAMEHDLIRP